MGWVLGFGIPIAYCVVGALFSRASWRSRHKRGLNVGSYGYYSDTDSQFLAFFMFLWWPILAPAYFTTITIQRAFHAHSLSELVEKFYNHNLPETNETKRLRKLTEAKARQDKIKSLEKELGIGSENDL